MDPVSAVASVIAIYQLASAISGLCFHYSQGVRRADRDADLVINEIDIFQKYLRSMKEILINEQLATASTDRLRSLDEIINGQSAALNLCRQDLEVIQTELVKAQSGGRFKETVRKLSWPLRKEELDKKLNTLKKFTEAVDRALNVDNNEIIRGIDSKIQQIQESLKLTELQKKRQEEFFEQSQEQLRAEETKQKILGWLAHPDRSESMRSHATTGMTGQRLVDGSLTDQSFKSSERTLNQSFGFMETPDTENRSYVLPSSMRSSHFNVATQSLS